MKADPQKLRHTLSKNLISRDSKHLENLDRVAPFIHEHFELYAEDVKDQPYTAEGMTVHNV